MGSDILEKRWILTPLPTPFFQIWAPLECYPKLIHKFWKKCFKYYKQLLYAFLKLSPIQLLYCPIWDQHLFMMNKKFCTQRDFSSLYNYVSTPSDMLNMTAHGLSFVNVQEISTRFNSEINPDEYLNLRQIIRHSASYIGLNLITAKLTLPHRPTGLSLINVSNTGYCSGTIMYKLPAFNTQSIVHRKIGKICLEIFRIFYLGIGATKTSQIYALIKN